MTTPIRCAEFRPEGRPYVIRPAQGRAMIHGGADFVTLDFMGQDRFTGITQHIVGELVQRDL